jgi:hypothetical protein
MHIRPLHITQQNLKNKFNIAFSLYANVPQAVHFVPNTHNQNMELKITAMRTRLTPRFALPTFGRPHAVALHFVRCGQLTEGLSPPGLHSCGAHNEKNRHSRFHHQGCIFAIPVREGASPPCPCLKQSNRNRNREWRGGLSIQALDQQAHQQSSQRSKRAIFLPFHMLFLHIRPQAKRNIMISA